MISVGLSKNLDNQVNNVSKLLNISKDIFIKEAIENYLEDRMDYLDAVKILSEDKDWHSMDEVMNEFKDDLQDWVFRYCCKTAKEIREVIKTTDIKVY